MITEKKKEEYAPFYYTLLEKAPNPVRIDWLQLWTEKTQGRPRIHTWPAETECHNSTTCATTTS